jgi:excisionase family DNA binding protein
MAKLLSIQELSEWWGVSLEHIRKLCAKRKLPSYSIGGRRVFICEECFWYLLAPGSFYKRPKSHGGKKMPKLTAELAEKPLPVGVDRARLLSIQQLSAWWGVSRKHIWELCTKRKGEKKLPSYFIGRRRVFIYDECFWYLKKQEAP